MGTTFPTRAQVRAQRQINPIRPTFLTGALLRARFVLRVVETALFLPLQPRPTRWLIPVPTPLACSTFTGALSVRHGCLLPEGLRWLPPTECNRLPARISLRSRAARRVGQ